MYDQLAAALTLEDFFEKLLLDEGRCTGGIAVLGLVLLIAFLNDLPEAVRQLTAAALIFGGSLRVSWPRDAAPFLRLFALLLVAATREEALLNAVALVRVVTGLIEAQHHLAHFHRGSFKVVRLDDLDDTLHSGVNSATIFKYTTVREAEPMELLRAFEEQ